MEGKSTRPPLPEISTKKYELNELLVIDLICSMNVPTWDSNLYILVIVEVSCCYPIRRLLKHKKQTCAEVRVVVA